MAGTCIFLSCWVFAAAREKIPAGIRENKTDWGWLPQPELLRKEKIKINCKKSERCYVVKRCCECLDPAGRGETPPVPSGPTGPPCGGAAGSGTTGLGVNAGKTRVLCAIRVLQEGDALPSAHGRGELF